MIRRTIFEWQEIRYGLGDDEIPIQAADRIVSNVLTAAIGGNAGGKVLDQGRKGLRARGVVGVIATEGCALEILPKMDVPGGQGQEAAGNIRRRLVHMLDVALDLKIDAGRLTKLDWQRETLLEILVRVFSEKLADAVRQGMPRHYVSYADDLATARGRLDAKRQFTTLAADPSRLACRYDALTADITLNQIMKAAVMRLRRSARTVGNQHRLRELAFAYADVSDVPVASVRWETVILDRTNSRWRELLSLARLLLGGQFQTTSSGGSDGISLLFEMSALFEEYVARMLSRSLVGTGLRVISQGGRLYCLEAMDGRGLFQTRPDIQIKRGDKVIQIIDTKWKRIANISDDPKRGVSQGDVYQMMAYGQLYKCDRLTLLYPHHESLQQAEGAQSRHKVACGTQWIETATIDISQGKMLGERLRAILDHPSPKLSPA
jgi:5-methylcytosine-specific restriction enzyme subunit McrC